MGKKKKVKEERERGVDYIIHEETDVREREKTIGNRDLSLDECLKGGRGQLLDIETAKSVQKFKYSMYPVSHRSHTDR